jgi:adenosylmethionine-8-amino-7-oxononanoate aminotransferase
MHFTELERYRDVEPCTIVRGRGAYVWDKQGRRYFDGLSSLYAVNVGHGRREIADAVAKQLRELEYFPIWNWATDPALELAERIRSLAPADLNWSFFTSGGSESIETAWKLTRQYHALRGAPGKFKIISRAGSYHGTTLGALSLTGTPSLREPFLPLVPGAVHAPKVDPFHADVDAETHSLQAANAIAELVDSEDPDTVGAVIVEPVQNSGGCLVAEPIYFKRLREICDQNELLLISDETICSWGRLGSMFGCEMLGYTPDIITTAKGLTSAYVPMGAVIASDRVVEPFLEPNQAFWHGITFGGHPAAAVAALANIELIEREELCARASVLGAHFRAELEALYELPIVGDVRGIGMFQAIELVADRSSRTPLTPEQLLILAEWLPPELLGRGLICRAMHRGAPLLQFAPTLVSTADDLSRAAQTLQDVLAEAIVRLKRE